jgi:hypothetical protein|tara:strand:+ start:930 stop:1181 length:252 start_codon:yes stop_codon:yes gene_type:complete
MADVDAALAFLAPDETGAYPSRRIERARLDAPARASLGSELASDFFKVSNADGTRASPAPSALTRAYLPAYLPAQARRCSPGY